VLAGPPAAHPHFLGMLERQEHDTPPVCVRGEGLPPRILARAGDDVDHRPLAPDTPGAAITW